MNLFDKYADISKAIHIEAHYMMFYSHPRRHIHWFYIHIAESFTILCTIKSIPSYYFSMDENVLLQSIKPVWNLKVEYLCIYPSLLSLFISQLRNNLVLEINLFTKEWGTENYYMSNVQLSKLHETE